MMILLRIQYPLKAGLGTGSTSTDSCRIGSSSYGQLIYNSLDDSNLTFQNLACSGDKFNGLYNKIELWENPNNASFGTLSIGGNDLGFTDIIKHCLLRWYRSPVLYWDRWWCSHYKAAATALIADTSEDGFQYQLKEIYKNISTKAGDTEFDLYVTGYPQFFNGDNEDCNYTTFMWGWEHYYSGSFADWLKSDPREVWLTTDVRQEFNDIVQSANQAIEAAVKTANTEIGTSVIHYVDVDTSFEGHRWCEEGVHEPDPDNVNTYFFLSGWKDVTESGTIT
ncbi:mutanase, partial [Penicillium taxi]|uniref:mutanase n=1 Tax=Penicillium taxi TaxID=168475 RepID=UPI0025455789